MKIVQIGPYPMDVECIKGGVEASVYGLANELSKGHEVFVFDVPREEIKESYKTPIGKLIVYRFNRLGKSNNSSLLSVIGYLKEIKLIEPDVCHIHTSNLFAFVLYLLLRTSGLKVVVTIHGLAHIEKRNEYKKNKGIRTFLKYFYQSLVEFVFLSMCRSIIVDTEYVASAIRKYKEEHKIWRLPEMAVIPQGINERFFDITDNAQPFELLSVGAFTKRKGHDKLVDVVLQLKDEFPAIKLNIVGVKSDVAYFYFLQKKIFECGLEQHIFLHPNTSLDQVYSFYSTASVFVLHSEEESQGIVFCEAMAAGKPIVATNVGGVPWVVKNGVNGFLSDHGDVVLFACNVSKLISNFDVRLALNRINRKRSFLYSWQLTSDTLMSLYLRSLY